MPKAALPRIGAHTPTSGGMAKRSIEYARITEAEAIQVFTSNPRGWAMPESNHEADALFRERANELDLEVYVHAPFLINLGSPTEGTYKNSLASTEYSLKRGQEIGALGVVVHTGSAVNEDFVESAWKQIHEGMMPIREGATANQIYSSNNYLTVFVDGEYHGELKRRVFEQPLLLSPAVYPPFASNYFAISDKFDSTPFKISFKDFSIKGFLY